MGRIAWSQARFRSGRALALLLGMMFAATAFTVLTAASQTAQLRTTGTVTSNFRAAYDILVRPKGSRTGLEVRTGTVQPNFLSGIYGGISMAQYHKITAIPGVQVAAPIAMIGYTFLYDPIPVRLPPAVAARPGRQVYRYITTWVSDGGSTRIREPPSYSYVTPNPLELVSGTSSPVTYERLPSGARAAVCPSLSPLTTDNVFTPAGQSSTMCWSKLNGLGSGGGGESFANLDAAHPGNTIDWSIPVLIAAIDPQAEARLDGLNHAVVSGDYLAENAGSHFVQPISTTFPVLAAASGGLGEYSVTQVQELPSPAGPATLSLSWMRAEAAVPGRTVQTVRVTAQQAYQALLAQISGKSLSVGIDNYWSVGPTRYIRNSSGALTPIVVHNPLSVWNAAGQPPYAPVDNEGSQYRALTLVAGGNAFTGGIPTPVLTGIFDPAKIRAFDPLSQVPLGPYEPVAAAPASPASKHVLHGQDLLPNQNIGGYVSQPADLITTLASLPAMENSGLFSGNLHKADPISVIRVRVAGVTGPNRVSLERIKAVAQQIVQRTGLDVDIVAGSSPSPTTIDLPAGKFGQPSLQLSEGWVKKGIVVTILNAVDKKSVVLFTLVLVVCTLFVANSATAAVHGRRRELGILACLGWTRPRLFAIVLGELAAIGLTAGLLGALAALPLAAALGLRASAERAVLAIPIAVAVAVLAGAVPAWLAARADPVECVRPQVAAVRPARHPRGITSMAVSNVSRTPGRTLVGALALAVGVGALTIVTALTYAFRGVLVGSLMGDAVAIQVRGVDYVAVAATVSMGVLAVTDVIFLNIRERAGELATIRAFGWTERSLVRMVVTEGTAIGVAGSLAGAVLGLAAAAKFAGELPTALFAVAAAAAAAGVLVTSAAAVVPAEFLRRMPAAQLLAED
jgi:putative ABC transport system permease protein